jgi:hypothetical protein
MYGFFEHHLKTVKAVVFHLENGCHNSGIYHTNFWALRDKQFWPPLAQKEDRDILELLWGNQLKARGLNNFFLSTNWANKRFIHAHQSEELPPFPVQPQSLTNGVFMIIGADSTWIKFKKVLFNLLKGLSWRK